MHGGFFCVFFLFRCEWGEDNPWDWAQTVGNSWRTTGDISDNWRSVLSNFDRNGPASAAGPGGWNDPDMLEVGNGGLTLNEEIAHFSMWCAAKAPLIVGCDIRNMSDTTKMILTNTEAIAINQDPLGQQVSLVATATNKSLWQVYSSALEVASGGPLAVLFLNRGESNETVSVSWDDLGVNSDTSYIVRDVNKHKTLGKYTGSFSDVIESHSAGLYRFNITS